MHFRPHLITIQSASQGASAGHDEGQLEYTREGGVRGLIDPMTQDAAFTAYALEIKRPSRMLLEIGDDRGLAQGGVVKCSGRAYRVVFGPVIHQAGLPTDHVEFALEEIANAPA